MGGEAVGTPVDELNVKHHRTKQGNRRYMDNRERRSCAGQKIVPGIEHQNVHRRRSSSSSASIYIRVYTSEADFHKPEIYGGRVRVWATEWDVFHCTPSRGGRGRQAAVDLFRGVFFLCLVGFRVFFVRFFSSNTRPAASMRPPCLIYLSTTMITLYSFCISLSQEFKLLYYF